MALELPAQPNFSAAVPPSSSPLDQYGKMLQLKALMGQQQLIPLQVEEQQEKVKQAQLESEMQQMKLQGQKALTSYWSNPDQFQSKQTDFPHNDALAGMLGVAPDDPLMATVRGQMKAGVPAPIAFAEAKNTLQMRQEASKATQEQQGVLKNAFEQLREISGPILAEKDATKKQALIEAAAPSLATWAKFDPTLAQVIPSLHAGNFDAFANRIGAEEKALGITKSGADAEKAQIETQKAKEELPGGKLVPVEQQELQSYLKDADVPGEKLPPAKRNAASFAAWKAKQNPAAQIITSNMLGGNNAALDQAAQRYSQTGELPAGFARSPGTTAAIIKRSAELNPDANLAANKATFTADTAALKKVQTQFDAMTAFEGTALKNLDLYAQIAAKIPDLGAKFANTPLRKITGSMIGTDNMAALNAARQTASSEVAKVLSSATGSGVLSDSQKKEAEDVINGNLPLSATLAVVDTLKKDMANRHQSYLDDINAIRGRMGAKPQGGGDGAAGGGANDFFSKFGGKARQ
jgi:hypothetical protein